MVDRGTNRAALVFGVFFVVTGVAFLLERLDVWDLRLKYVAPALLISLGVAVLLGGRRERRS
jgi:LiaI-LiaF-like transmembrane region